jgi:hypothetical protein
MLRILFLLLAFLGLFGSTATAQTLDASQFRIDWQVVNRFRLFSDARFFKLHENAWRQYLLHVDGRNMELEQRDSYIARTSVLGANMC